MGNYISSFWNEDPPPPMVLVPPIFDFPPLAFRTSMLVPAYDLLFGKLALRCLFEDYFEKARQLNAKIMLKPLEDHHVDMVATISSPLDPKAGDDVAGNALFRWQRDLDDPHTFIDVCISTKPMLRLRSCAYYPKLGFGAFGMFPILIPKRILLPEDFGVVGLRYGSEKLSFGAMFIPFHASECPVSAWVVGRTGRLSLGMKYDPPNGSSLPLNFINLKSWSYAIGYGLGSSSPLSPSFNFSLELVKNSQLIASFYQHVVVQRRVQNPFEENQVVGITNYIDFGLELTTKIDRGKTVGSVEESSFQIAAAWQANKNFFLKGKTGPLSSALTLAFKTWWKPSFTFSITAINNRLSGMTSFGFGIRAENLREPSYERADPNYVMLTPNKEHLAEGVLRDFGKRPMFQSEINSGNYDHLPKELKPMGKLF